MMLHRNAVRKELWDLLEKLMRADALSSFFLVGGTALALRLGHRESDDLDLFTIDEFNEEQISDYIARELHAERVYHEPDTVRAFIDGVKVDILRHDYPLLAPVTVEEGIRMASQQDLAAMKLNAVSGRGLKKDFWDVAALLKDHSMGHLLDCYRDKYGSGDIWHLMRALNWFEDAEADETRIRSIWHVEWLEVRSTVSKAVNKSVGKEL